MNPLVPLLVAALSGSLPPQEPISPAAPVRSARVLLVGCTEYPFLTKEGGKVAGSNTIALAGPVNDVDLFAKTLEEVFAVPASRMTKLAGWPADESARPTKSNIVRALQELERAAQKGEWIVVYMAGHGSQQPSSSESLSDEPDGLDEVFLPADVRPSPDGEKIPNGLSDDEIADLVRRIRAKGADVWLVIDSCHSGTMLRGGGADDVVLRFVSPDRLGVRGAGGRKKSAAPAAAKPSDAFTTDGIVAFYGAQSFGSAPEMKLPPDAEKPEPHGLYTYLLARELHALGSTASYGELATRVTAAYQAFPCNLTVPLAEGDLSQIVGSGARAQTPPLFLFIGNGPLRLDHGMLAGIETGVVLEVARPDDPAGPPIAQVEVTRAGLHEAEVTLKSGTLPAGPATCTARLHSRSLSEFRLSIALVTADEKPVKIDALPEAARLALQEKAARFPIVADPAKADWRIVVDGARMHLRAAGHAGSADILDVPPARLGERLEQLLKVHNLRRLCGLFPPTGEAIQVRVEHRARSGEAAARLKPGDQLRPGEEIRVLLQKSADAIYDVTVLYLDANWNVLCLYPERGRSARLEREARAEFDLTDWVTVTDDALGAESVWVMAVPRGPSDPEVNLSWIAGQEVLTRGALEQDAARKVFGDLLRGPVTRGLGSGKAGPPEGSLFQIPITTSWPRLGAPDWGRTAKKGLKEPLDCLKDMPVPVELGTCWSKFESPAMAGSEGVLLIGSEKAPQAVLVDLRGKFEGSDPSAFHSQAAFLFPESGTRLALYDRKDPEGFDLCLEDGDRDGMAERRWTKAGSTWTLEDRVAVPWLSQSYIGTVPDKVKATACLRILARE